jgi:hypothetical protein
LNVRLGNTRRVVTAAPALAAFAGATQAVFDGRASSPPTGVGVGVGDGCWLSPLDEEWQPAATQPAKIAIAFGTDFTHAPCAAPVQFMLAKLP